MLPGERRPNFVHMPELDERLEELADEVAFERWKENEPFWRNMLEVLGEERIYSDEDIFTIPASHHWPSHVRVYPPEDQ